MATSSQPLIPTPKFLPPGYSPVSCVLQCFLPCGEMLKLGVGISFGVPGVVGPGHTVRRAKLRVSIFRPASG